MVTPSSLGYTELIRPDMASSSPKKDLSASMTRAVQIPTVDLASLPVGAHGIVHELQGGRGFIARLATLGLTVGAQVTVLQNHGHGPLTILVRGTRVALGRHEARRILIIPTEGAP